jgi:hypothetical protein
MQIDQVPQDQGMIDGDRHEVCYAVNKEGHYVLVQSAGWEPKNVVNDQAWDLIKKKVAATTAKVRAGKLSSLAYHMVCNQMNVGLLSKYVPYGRLRVWLHLRPKVFHRLTSEELRPYADLFDLSVAELKTVPDGRIE